MLIFQYPALRVLALAQALYWSCSIIGITLTSLVGKSLAPVPWLATLPLTLMVAGTLLTVRIVARRIHRQGRRRGLQWGALMGAAGGGLCFGGVALHSFALFGLGCFVLGAYPASSGFYRFAALEGVEPDRKGQAAGWVVGGGVLAALLAPSLAIWSRDALSLPWAGAYVCIAVLALLSWLLLAWLPDGASGSAAVKDASAPESAVSARALFQRPEIRAALFVSAGGQGLMILLMNATPLAMDICGLPLADAAHVIQWHVLGMFLPSFVAGPAIDRLGARKAAWTGMALIAASVLTAWSGALTVYFLVSSCLLGMGWNFMLLAGTALLAKSHSRDEQPQAQALMEWSNSAMAATMSFGSGALLQTMGWNLVNAAAVPVLLIVALQLAGPARRRMASY